MIRSMQGLFSQIACRLLLICWGGSAFAEDGQARLVTCQSSGQSWALFGDSGAWQGERPVEVTAVGSETDPRTGLHTILSATLHPKDLSLKFPGFWKPRMLAPQSCHKAGEDREPAAAPYLRTLFMSVNFCFLISVADLHCSG